MKKSLVDWKLLLGYLIAHLFIYFSFDQTKVFWYLLTGTTLFLISFTVMNEEIDDQAPLFQYLLYGIASGLVLYGLFWIGNLLIDVLSIKPFDKQVDKLYSKFAPESIWHYIPLILVIIPGEEFFWRGFILKRISTFFNKWTSIIVSTILYASVYIFTDYPILILTALIVGVVLGWLYQWKKSLPLVIISHLTFSLMMFLFLPFR